MRAERSRRAPVRPRRSSRRSGPPRVTVVSLHPTAPGGAASTHILGIAGGLRDLGWQVEITAVSDGATSRSFTARLRGWITTSIAAARTLYRTDVVYLRSHPAAAPLVLAARLARVPVVVEVNGPDEDYLAAWPQLRRTPWVISRPVGHQLRSAAAVVAVTEGLARWVEDRTGRAATVVGNGVDAARFVPSGRAAEARYVLFVGALAPWQGTRELLAAAERPEWPEGVELVIAGDGAERAAVRRAAELRPTRVRWLGHVTPDRVPGLLDGALAAAVLSRDRHGTGVSPLKLYEAMASATPVIVADVPGVADTVRATGCGVVVPADDVGAIATAVARLAGTPGDAEAMGLRGRSAAMDEHTWSARAASTAVVLRAVLDGKDSL